MASRAERTTLQECLEALALRFESCALDRAFDRSDLEAREIEYHWTDYSSIERLTGQIDAFNEASRICRKHAPVMRDVEAPRTASFDVIERVPAPLEYLAGNRHSYWRVRCRGCGAVAVRQRQTVEKSKGCGSCSRASSTPKRKAMWMHYVLINKTTKGRLDGDTLAKIAAALEGQADDLCALGWVTDACVAVGDAADPAAGEWPIYFLDDPDQPDALGDHDEGASRVFVEPIFAAGGTLTEGALSVSAVASHEFCETEGDPPANFWADSGAGYFVALELCDPVEGDTYADADGVALSNFVARAWFDPLATGGPFDKMGKVSGPLLMTAGGYMIKAQAGGVSEVFASSSRNWTTREGAIAQKTHANARRVRRLAVSVSSAASASASDNLAELRAELEQVRAGIDEVRGELAAKADK